MKKVRAWVGTGAVVVAGVVALLGSATAARAEDAPAPPQSEWIGKGQGGFLQSKGNTDAQSINAAFDTWRFDGNWKNELTVSGLYGKSSGILSAERWEVHEQTNYNFSPRLFGFGGLNFEHDMFDGFVYQASVVAGAGYKFIDSKSTQLTVQLGGGFRRLRPEDIIKDPAGSGAVVQRIPLEVESEAIGTGAVDFAHKFNESTVLSDKLVVETGKSNTSAKNILALTVKMTNKLALSVGYTVYDNTHPADGLKKVDTTTTLNLVYAFNGAK